MFKNKPTQAAIDFLKLFIKPILKAQVDRNEEPTVGAALSLFFGEGQRDVFSVSVKEPFILPGHYLAAGNKVLPGVGEKQLVKGERLLISLDTGYRFVIVEKEDGTTFRLTKTNYNSIRDHFENIKKARFRDSQHSSLRSRD